MLGPRAAIRSMHRESYLRPALATTFTRDRGPHGDQIVAVDQTEVRSALANQTEFSRADLAVAMRDQDVDPAVGAFA